MRKVLFILLILLNGAACFGEYRKIDTGYFNLIYDKKLRDKVEKFAGNADETAEKVFKFYNFNPKQKYNIIFRDNSDNDNGLTEYNTIKLYFNRVPFFYVEKNYNEWIDYVFIHELTHLVINLKSKGVIGKSFIFKPILQQAFIPAWYQEGLAVYTESRLFSGGRGNSPRFKMYIRAAINEDKFEGFKYAGNYNIDGNNSYIYGYSFIEFFSSVYGEEELKKSIEQFSKHQIKGPFYNAAGKTREELFNEWKEWTKRNYVSGKGEKEGEIFSKSFGDKRNLKFNKGKLYFYSEKFSEIEKKEKTNGIYSIEIENRKIKKENGAKIIEGFEVSENNLYYSMIIPDFIKGKKRAAAYKSEAGILSEEYLKLKKAVNFFNIDSKTGVVIREKGKERVITTDGEEIISADYGFKFEKFSYGEEKIYFSAATEKENGNYLYCYDIVKKKIIKMCEGASPCFYKNNLYYSKNYKGIYNIFRIILNTGKIERVTDVKYGAFEPALDDEENVYYLNYNSNGYSIYKTTAENSYKTKEILKSEEVNLKENETVSKSYKTGEIKVSGEKFNDTLIFRNGFITNKNIILNTSDTFNEKKLILIAGEIKDRRKNLKNYEIYSEDSRDKTGISGAYIYSNGGIPLCIIYGEKVEGEDGYISGTLNIPYFNRNSKLLFIGDIEIDSIGKKGAGISIFGAAGYRAEWEKKVFENELYIKTERLKLNYCFAAKPVVFENKIADGINYNMKSSFKEIGYRFKTDELFVLRVDTGYNFEINKGSKTGRNMLKYIRTASENIYAVWNNNGQKDDILGFNLYIETGFFINYNFDCKFRVGTIEQYDTEMKKFLSDKEIPYLSFVIKI